MKAVRLHRPSPAAGGPLTFDDVAQPTPRANQVLVRIEACGVCHTDLHIIEGELPPKRLPLIPGHQVVGVVESAGGGVEPSWIGQRVGVAWLHQACGACEYCRRDAENLCPHILFTGYDVDGGYTTHLVAHHDFVYRIPDRFASPEAAPLLCAGIIGYRSLRLAEVSPGSRVGLFGFGASAHLALQVARHWGCEVYVFTRSDGHRRLAADLGAVWVGGSEDKPPRELDSAITFAPSGRVVVDALARLRRGGTLAINAVHLDGVPSFEYGLLYWERTIRSVSNSTRRDGREFLALAAAIPLRVATQMMPLREANAAVLRLKRGEVSGAIVLVPEGVNVSGRRSSRSDS